MVHHPIYDDFIVLNKPQLEVSGVPRHYWQTVYDKITNQIFDAGDVFTLLKVDYEDEVRTKYDPVWQVQVCTDFIKESDCRHVYLIDHAWTFRVEEAKKQLKEVDCLRERMCFIQGLDFEDAGVDKVFNEIWRYCNSYTIGNAVAIEERMPVWYVMDELGSGIQHSNEPNVRVVPFINNHDKMTYSLLFPVKDLRNEDFVYRDFIEGQLEVDRREALLLPWRFKRFTNDFRHVPVDNAYFLSGHIAETLPDLQPQEKSLQYTYKVYTEYQFIATYLTSDKFVFVDDECDADILWYTKHFRDYEKLSCTPGVFINQFPFEYVVTIKDLLPVTCRINNKNEIGSPNWLPITYNLKTELNEFVSYYQHRETHGLDNHWIIKPFNLARGLDTHITSNINHILRLPATGPKIAQKYIENPLLYYREDCNGRVKFDIRYVILLKSVKPLQVYIYKNFFLRFANVPYELNNFDHYEKHFTVMNYKSDVQLKRVLCAEFKTEFEKQNDTAWKTVEDDICKVIKAVFTKATTHDPPRGIAHNPQSRALYAADLMLERSNQGDIIPKLLEINWTPDCKRACEYYPDFYNDIFNLLFTDIMNPNVFVML